MQAKAKPVQTSPASFRPLKRSPAYLKLAEVIRGRILAGELAPGEALPTETALAAQLCVNRSTLREALRHLQSAGLLERPGGGKKLVIARPALEGLSHGVSAALTLHGARFADVWEALLAVEPAIAAAAARRATAAQRGELRALAATFADGQGADQDRVVTVGNFFRLLGACTSNPVFVVAHEPLIRLLEPGLARIINVLPQAPRRIADAQTALCTALEAGNPDEAARWMRRHIEDFRRGFEHAGLSPDTVVGGAP